MTHPSFGSHILQISHILPGVRIDFTLARYALRSAFLDGASRLATIRPSRSESARGASSSARRHGPLISCRRSWASDSSFDFWSAVRLIPKGIHIALGPRSGIWLAAVQTPVGVAVQQGAAAPLVWAKEVKR